ncbi:MAG: hypothetical protein RLY93_20270 [Sumerlaeia bacterium]
MDCGLGLARAAWSRADWLWLGALAVVGLIAFQAITPIGTMASKMPYGDAVINGYLLGWAADVWWRAPWAFFDAPAFYPQADALTNMDPIVVPAVFVTPLWWLTHRFALIYNFGMLMALWTALWAMYAMLRDVTPVPRAAAAAAAVLMAINTDRWWHSAGHINQVWTFVLPLAFWAGWRVMARPGWRSAVLAGLAGLAALWCSFYLLVFAAFCGLAGVVAAPLALWRKPSRQGLLTLAAAAGIAVVLMAPTLLVYARAGEKVGAYRGGLSENIIHSASLAGWIAPPWQPGRLTSPLSELFAPGDAPPRTVGEDAQFIGYGLLVLLLAEAGRLGWLAARRRWRALERLSALALGMAGFAFLCSMGPYWGDWRPGPFLVVYEVLLAPLKFFRVPARFATVFQLFSAISVAVFLASLIAARARVGLGVAAGAAALAVVEHWPVQFVPRFTPIQDQAALTMLAERDPSFAEPFVALPDPQNCYAGLASRAGLRWRPMVNGWPNPPIDLGYDELMLVLSDLPSTRSLGVLAAMEPMPWIVTSSPEQTAAIVDDPRLEVRLSPDGRSALARVADPEAAAAAWEGRKSAFLRGIANGRQRVYGDQERTVLADAARGPFASGKALGFQAEPKRGEGLVLNAMRQIGPGLEVVLPKPILAQTFDVLEVELRSERDLENQPVQVYWATANSPFIERNSVLGGIEPLPLAEGGGEGQWRATIPMSEHPDWFFQPEPLTMLRIDFDGYNPADDRPITVVRFVARRLPGPPVAAY